ncbi:MAG TPA: 5-formyltetrahydrofolate cyclo-ligase [Actinobacteria bacterium]|nr:5-formyltetrahydrofolate cyclo-ligase [Actinomycetota bacterium]
MIEPGLSASKSEWRRWAADRRQDLPSSRAFVSHILEWLRQAPPGLVVTYLAMGDEIDLAETVARSDRRFGLTRTPPPGGLLTVHAYESAREPHRFGFDQPVAESEQIPASEIAVVLVPGLVFDEHGGRLGRGAGYYDRFLAALTDDVFLVGIVPDELIVARLPDETHDVAMTHLATETGVRSVRTPG